MLVLHNRAFLRGSPQRRALAWIAVVVILLIAVAVTLLWAIACTAEPGLDTADRLRQLWLRLQDDPRAVFVLIGAPVAFGFLVLLGYSSRARERLNLSPTGIEYRSPIGGPLNFMQRDWALQWCEVRSARIGKMFRYAGGHLAALIMDTGERRRRLMLYPWVDPSSYRPRSLREERTFIRALQAQGSVYDDWVCTNPVVAYITENVRSLEIDTAASSSSAFALEKHPWAFGSVVTFFLLASYLLIDGFIVVGEIYAHTPPYTLFAGSGLLAAIVAIAQLRARGVPALESGVLGMMLGTALGCALYPGVLRLNQWTDESGLRPTTYESKGEGRFVSVDADLPELRFDDYPEYWRQVAAGQRYEFELRRGGLGFYQVNLVPIRASIAHFYRAIGEPGGHASADGPS